MYEKDITQLKDSMTMPSDMAETLVQNCTSPRKDHNRYSHYSRLCAAFASLLLFTAIGSTSMAAYNVYQDKQLAVFMDSDLSQEEIAAIGDELARIPELSCRYISGDEAWEQFKTEYLGDLADSFDTNPLADSFNYEVSVRLGADTQAIRDKISRIEGVRQITTLRELNEADTKN